MADNPQTDKLQDLDARVAKLEGLFEQIDARLTRLETEVTEGFSELRREMRRQLYWILGLVVVGYLVPIALRFVPGG